MIDELFERIAAAQEAGTYLCCPRCGSGLEIPMVCNPLSSHVRDVFICSICAASEQISPGGLPPDQWYCTKLIKPTYTSSLKESECEGGGCRS